MSSVKKRTLDNYTPPHKRSAVAETALHKLGRDVHIPSDEKVAANVELARKSSAVERLSQQRTETEETASESIDDNSTETTLLSLVAGALVRKPRLLVVAHSLLDANLAPGDTSIYHSMANHKLRQSIYEDSIVAVTDRAHETDLGDMMALESWASHLGDENLIIEYAMSKTPTVPAIETILGQDLKKKAVKKMFARLVCRELKSRLCAVDE